MSVLSGILKGFRLVRHNFQTEGFLSLVKRGFLFFGGTYYLYRVNPEEALKELNEPDFIPKFKNFELKTISTVGEFDEISARGYRIPVVDRDRLADGQTTLCVFIDKELAHTMWAAMDEKARKGADSLPFKVDFAKKEACGGWTWTNPKYRGMGLCAYVGIKRLEFLKDRGIVKFWSSAHTGNIAAQKTLQKLGHKKYAQGRYLRILWWKLWREKLLT
jgi:hypothetical protein